MVERIEEHLKRERLLTDEPTPGTSAHRYARNEQARHMKFLREVIGLVENIKRGRHL